MKRKIELEISSCIECPYYIHDSHYSMSYDSGYDCVETGNRVLDDSIDKKYNKELKEWNESQKTLFKKPIEEKPINPLTEYFNKKCPLEKI